MSTDTGVTGPRISSYMNLEQAMGEVRAYLDKKKRQAGMPPELAGFAAGQLSMQSAFIARLADIASRLGQVEPNSKLGAPGVFLKRLGGKMIGWYSRPAQEFDRTTIEAFHQIRSDMLQLQQHIAALDKRVAEGLQGTKGIGSGWNPASPSDDHQDELMRSMFTLFKGLIATPSVRQSLQDENPALLDKVQGLLKAVEAEFHESQLPRIKSAPDR
jgi:hypothetical protein